MKKLIIQEDGINIYVEENNGTININSKRPISKLLTTISRINSSYLINRNDDVIRLKNLLESSNTPTAITGIGGGGKTTLASIYLDKYYETYTHIAWITVFEGEIKKSFVFNEELTDNLFIEVGENKNIEEAFAQILNRLRAFKGKNLIVIDNADSNVEDLRNEISLSNNWDVIVTSRGKLEYFNPFVLPELSTQSCKELFLKHYKGVYKEADLVELINLVGHHSLTIELLAKTLEKNYNLQNDIQKLIEYLKNDNLDAKDLEVIVKIANGQKEVTIYKYLLSIFNTIKLNTEEKKILRRFSFFPSIDIHGNFLNLLIKSNDEDSNELHNVLNQLNTKGWLINKVRQHFKCHTIIQDIVRYKEPPSFELDGWYFMELMHLVPQLKLHHQKFLIPFLEIAGKYFNRVIDESDTFYLMVASIYNKLGYIDDGIETINKFSEKKTNGKVSRKIAHADLIYTTGDYKKAIELYIESLNLIREYDHTDEIFNSTNIKAKILHQLGSAYTQLQDYIKAYLYFLDELEIYDEKRDKHGINNLLRIKYVDCYHSIAKVQLGKNEVNDSLMLSKRAMNLLAHIKQNPEPLDKFEGITEEKVSIKESDILSNLTDIYIEKKDYNLALKYAMQDYNILSERMKSNPDSIDIRKESLVSMSKVADILVVKKDYLKAINIFTTLCERFEFLVKNFKEIINLKYYLSISYNKTANCFFLMGKIDEGMNALIKSVNAAEAIYETMPNSSLYLSHLIESIIMLKAKYEENNLAEDSVKASFRLLELYEKTPDSTDKYVNLFLNLHTIGKFYFSNKEWKQAISYFFLSIKQSESFGNQVLEGYVRGSVTYILAQNYLNLGVSLINISEKEEAKKSLRTSKEWWQRLYSETKDNSFIQKIKEIDDILESLKPKKKWWQI